MKRVTLAQVLKECKRRGIRFAMGRDDLDKFRDTCMEINNLFYGKGVFRRYKDNLLVLKQWGFQMPKAFALLRHLENLQRLMDAVGYEWSDIDRRY